MQGGFFNKQRLHKYGILLVLILSGIFIFYLSCKSKSPTEATSALHNQVASQSTNNTTTSSSTTTTVKPGNSPTNTTTLITSRTLTTTSTRKLTTSTTTSVLPNTTTTQRKSVATTTREPSKTTSTIVPTTSTSSTSSTSTSSTTSTSTTSSTSTSTTSTSTTTTVATPDLSFCSFTIADRYGRTQTISNGDTFVSVVDWDDNTLTIYPAIRNDGAAPAVDVTLSYTSSSGFEITILDGSSWFDTIPVGDCIQNDDTIRIYHLAQSMGSTCQVTLTEGYSNKTFTFTILTTN